MDRYTLYIKIKGIINGQILKLHIVTKNNGYFLGKSYYFWSGSFNTINFSTLIALIFFFLVSYGSIVSFFISFLVCFLVSFLVCFLVSFLFLF